MRVVVRDDVVDHEPAAQRRARAASTVSVALSSCARVGSSAARLRERPAVVLDVRHLHPPGAEFERELDQLGQAVQVLSVDHGVEGQRQALGAHDRGEAQLARVAAA